MELKEKIQCACLLFFWFIGDGERDDVEGIEAMAVAVAMRTVNFGLELAVEKIYYG